MSNNALREGFREVFRDPALLLIEVGWRWAFGFVAILVCARIAALTMSGVRAHPPAFESISRMNPWRLAQSIASVMSSLGAALVRIGPVAVVFLGVCWIVLSGLGRRATLTRPALTPAAGLRSCFSVSTVRALLALGALVAWILAGTVAGVIVALTSGSSAPNLGLILLILMPALLLIVSVWSTANWYLCLAPLFAEDRWTRCISSVWKLARSRRDEVLEISIATAAIRFVLLVVALVLSFAVSAVITNPRVIALDLFAIALLYFFAADFVSIARLVAFARLRDMSVEPADELVHPDSNSNVVLIRSNENAGA